MTSAQFSTIISTIINLFEEQNKYIDERFNQEAQERSAQLLDVMKAIEGPYLEHDKRITALESTVFPQ